MGRFTATLPWSTSSYTASEPACFGCWRESLDFPDRLHILIIALPGATSCCLLLCLDHTMTWDKKNALSTCLSPDQISCLIFEHKPVYHSTEMKFTLWYYRNDIFTLICPISSSGEQDACRLQCSQFWRNMMLYSC